MYVCMYARACADVYIYVLSYISQDIIGDEALKRMRCDHFIMLLQSRVSARTIVEAKQSLISAFNLVSMVAPKVRMQQNKCTAGLSFIFKTTIHFESIALWIGVSKWSNYSQNDINYKNH